MIELQTFKPEDVTGELLTKPGLIRTTISAGRLLRMPAKLRVMAFETRCDISMTIEKGWFTEDIMLIVRGTGANLLKFNEAIKAIKKSLGT